MCALVSISLSPPAQWRDSSPILRTPTAVWEELKKYEIPVLGLAKRFETLVIPQFKDNRLSFIQLRLPNIPAKNLLQRIRDEAHRFARRYHHKLVQRELLLV